MTHKEQNEAGVLVVTRLLFETASGSTGNPRLSQNIIGAYSPFHPAGRPFQRSHQPHQRLSTYHPHLAGGRVVSAPEPGLSPYALAGVAVLVVGGVSSSASRHSKAVRQLTSLIRIVESTKIRISFPNILE